MADLHEKNPRGSLSNGNTFNAVRLYHSSQFWLYVQLQLDRGADQTTLIGHLGDPRHPLEPLPGVTVMLISCGQVLQRCLTDTSGGVEMHYSSIDGATLHVVVGKDRFVAPVLECLF